MTPAVELPLASVLLPVSSSPARSETCTRSQWITMLLVATNLLSFFDFLFNFSTKLIFSKLSVCLRTKTGSILQKGLKPSRCIPFRLPASSASFRFSAAASSWHQPSLNLNSCSFQSKAPQSLQVGAANLVQDPQRSCLKFSKHLQGAIPQHIR